MARSGILTLRPIFTKSIRRSSIRRRIVAGFTESLSAAASTVSNAPIGSFLNPRSIMRPPCVASGVDTDGARVVLLVIGNNIIYR